MAKILVYDPDARFREVMKAALVSLGHEAVAAPDGYSVLPLAEQHKPQLFVLDYKLPEADGFEILKRLRATAAFAATPIIFASVTPKFEIEMTVLDAAAVGYVDKPLVIPQLKDALEAFLGTPRPASPPPAPPSAGRAEGAAFTGEPDLDGVRDGVIDID